jgi:hypothetical protein
MAEQMAADLAAVRAATEQIAAAAQAKRAGFGQELREEIAVAKGELARVDDLQRKHGRDLDRLAALTVNDVHPSWPRALRLRISAFERPLHHEDRVGMGDHPDDSCAQRAFRIRRDVALIKQSITFAIAAGEAALTRHTVFGLRGAGFRKIPADSGGRVLPGHDARRPTVPDAANRCYGPVHGPR